MLLGLMLVAISATLASASYGYQQQPYYEPYPPSGQYAAQDPYGYYGNEVYPSPYEQSVGYQDNSGYQNSYGQDVYGNYESEYANDPRSLKSSGHGHNTHSSHSSHNSRGYGHSSSYNKHTKYVPVISKPKKKKQKIISIDKGLFISGGSQAFGKFKSLKACMKACAATATCFAGDYNPWLGKCYFHSNSTACGTMQSHSKITHFKKVPCTAPGSSNTRVTLGAQLFGGIIQKGIDSLADCLKKCINAGGGVASAAGDLDEIGQGGQLCFGIDYDFSSHKCYFHTVRVQRLAAASQEPTALCDNVATAVRTPIDLAPNGNVVNIIICPSTA